MTRKFMRRMLTGAVAVFLLGAANPSSVNAAEAELRNAEGQVVGAVNLQAVPSGVLLHVRLSGIPEGVHGFHVHAVGLCDAPFTSAGGHYNPHAKVHGLLVDGGAHSGDMPNLTVPASGQLEVEILNTALRLDADLLDADGAAIVVHAGPDDYSSDPAGDAGPRIACGVIRN